MSDQFNRTYALRLGDMDFTQPLRCAFNIARDGTTLPNSAEIAVFNVSRETKAALQKLESVPCVLEAGHETTGNIGIFQGFTEEVYVAREGPTTFVRVSGSDGNNVKSQKKKDGKTPKPKEDKSPTLYIPRFKKSYPPGTPVVKILEEMANATGFGGAATDAISGAAFPAGHDKLERGLAIDGGAMSELRLFARSVGVEWSVQDGVIQFALAGQAARDSGVVLSAENGLIDSVQIDDEGYVSGSALIGVDLIPGVSFLLKSVNYEGPLICIKTNHVGDSYQGDWTVKWEAKQPG